MRAYLEANVIELLMAHFLQMFFLYQIINSILLLILKNILLYFKYFIYCQVYYFWVSDLLIFLLIAPVRFNTFGSAIRQRPPEDIAYAVARFFQNGGSLNNYYMVFVFLRINRQCIFIC